MIMYCFLCFYSYIKHKQSGARGLSKRVVYLLIPTSNHNRQRHEQKRRTLYIFWFLHQTTTPDIQRFIKRCCISFDSYIKPQRSPGVPCIQPGCISFDSYIKPQLHNRSHLPITCCISFDSYIKPQHQNNLLRKDYVVYLLIPTSNHNQCQTL